MPKIWNLDAILLDRNFSLTTNKNVVSDDNDAYVISTTTKKNSYISNIK